MNWHEDKPWSDPDGRFSRRKPAPMGPEPGHNLAEADARREAAEAADREAMKAGPAAFMAQWRASGRPGETHQTRCCRLWVPVSWRSSECPLCGGDTGYAYE